MASRTNKPSIEKAVELPSLEEIENTALPEGIKAEIRKTKALEEEETIVEDVENDADILARFIIEDPTNITIKNIPKSSKLSIQNENIVLKKKATKQIVAMQSAYIAHMSALSIGEVFAIRNSDQDLHADRNSLFKIIYTHLEESSLGYLSFEDFLNTTSYFDLQTLLFGIYCQTYREVNRVPVTCPACKTTTTLEINNEAFISTKDEGIYADLANILKSGNVADALSKSMVHTRDRIFLKDSKIIVDVFTPSLRDYLNLVKIIKEESIEEKQELLSLFLNIEQIFIPDVLNFKKTGQPSFYTIDNLEERFNFFCKINPNEFKILEKDIHERIKKRAIHYKTPEGIKCTRCPDQKTAGTFPSIIVDFEQMFFRKVAQ
jgi:hypothetical protein